MPAPETPDDQISRAVAAVDLAASRLRISITTHDNKRMDHDKMIVRHRNELAPVNNQVQMAEMEVNSARAALDRALDNLKGVTRP